MSLRKAAEMALGVIHNQGDVSVDEWVAVEAALRAALTEADETVPLAEYKKLQALVTEQGIRLMDAEADEPVAWMKIEDPWGGNEAHFSRDEQVGWTALYTHPPRREPLTDLTKGATWEQQK